MTTMQEKLNGLYADYLKVIYTDSDLKKQILDFELSSPIFLKCDTDFGEYIDSEFKILYVGQETNYWFNQKERERSKLLNSIDDIDKYLKALVDLYKSFNIGHDYKTDIFTFMDILVDKLRNKNKKTGILWTNLLRHDAFGNGKVSYDVEQKITYNENYIFRKELEILKPDAIVFVTGPNYDYIIENSFKGLEKLKVDNESERKICMLKHADLPVKSVRVYHPNAHKYQGADYRWDLADKIVELIEMK